MNARDFCFWLQGFFELNQGADELDARQANTIRNHLSLVFKHEIDPAMGGEEHQKVLNEIHSGPGLDPNRIIMRC